MKERLRRTYKTMNVRGLCALSKDKQYPVMKMSFPTEHCILPFFKIFDFFIS